jgi:hypothetical protein
MRFDFDCRGLDEGQREKCIELMGGGGFGGDAQRNLRSSWRSSSEAWR